MTAEAAITIIRAAMRLFFLIAAIPAALAHFIVMLPNEYIIAANIFTALLLATLYTRMRLI